MPMSLHLHINITKEKIMKRVRSMPRMVAAMLYIAFAMLSVQTPAQAAMVGTVEVVAAQQGAFDRAQLLGALARDDVRAPLTALGVAPADAAARVANLSDEELQAMNARMNELPAGGDVLGVVVFLFLVLLVTDTLGFTDIFPFVKKRARRACAPCADRCSLPPRSLVVGRGAIAPAVRVQRASAIHQMAYDAARATRACSRARRRALFPARTLSMRPRCARHGARVERQRGDVRVVGERSLCAGAQGQSAARAARRRASPRTRALCIAQRCRRRIARSRGGSYGARAAKPRSVVGAALALCGGSRLRSRASARGAAFGHGKKTRGVARVIRTHLAARPRMGRGGAAARGAAGHRGGTALTARGHKSGVVRRPARRGGGLQGRDAALAWKFVGVVRLGYQPVCRGR